MIGFVNLLNMDGVPLDPIHPAKARLLLKQKLAKVKGKYCVEGKLFVIQLVSRIGEEPVTGKYYLGVDPGSSTMGCSVISEAKILYQSETRMRNDVKKAIKEKSAFRKNRRYRKTRYRKPRYLHRSASCRGRKYAPSVKSKGNAHVREVDLICAIFPISGIVVEHTAFDTHALSKGKGRLNSWEYAKGEMYGYENTRAFVRKRDGFKCRHCGARGFGSNAVKLEVHHVMARAAGGSDAPSNLITLCENCHRLTHDGKIQLKAKPGKSRTKHATQTDIVRSYLIHHLAAGKIPFYLAHGYITKGKRLDLKLEKTHANDAASLAALLPGCESLEKHCDVIFRKCVARGTRKFCKGKRDEIEIPTGKVLGFRRFDKVQYEDGLYFISGRRSSGYFEFMDIFGKNQKIRPMPKTADIVRIKARRSCLAA